MGFDIYYIFCLFLLTKKKVQFDYLINRNRNSQKRKRSTAYLYKRKLPINSFKCKC